MKEIYRRCASVVVFRTMPDGSHAVLLLHKPRKRDDWQLPQGGVEGGESLEEAAIRELREEAGIGVHVLGESKRVYQYDFPLSYRRFRPDNLRGQRIRFVFAEAPIDGRVRVDGREINGFVWAGEADLPKYIKRREYREIVRSLLAEGADLLR
jgi:putative (di)nucleoside polyphosphate hydrolase